MNTYVRTTQGKILIRASRWIRIRTDYDVTPRHSCYYYAENTGDGGNAVDYFIFLGRKFAINRFYRFGTMFTPETIGYFDDDGKCCYISGYDSENYYNPLLIEVHPDGDYVRVYQEVENND